MNIPPPPAGFVVDGATPQDNQETPVTPPPPGFTLDAGQKTEDAPMPSAPENPFERRALKAGVHATERWNHFGAGVLSSPQRPQVEQFAIAKNLPLNEKTAGEWLKSTLPQPKVKQIDEDAHREYRIIEFINDRDRLGSEIAKQFKLANPQGSDEELYHYVHQNLLNAGKDNAQLPAFTVDPQTLEVKTDTGLVKGLLNRSVASLLAFPSGTAQAGAKLIQQGVYQASKPFYDEANPYAEAVRRQNAGLESFNAGVESSLPGSTAGKNNPVYGLVEEGVASVPSLLLLSGVGNLGKLGKLAEWGQIAGMEFNKAYDHSYQDGLKSGLNPGQASERATVAGAIDSAINTYLMTKGTLGQKGGTGVAGRLRAALTGALPQGGVAGGQEFIRQISSYALTGQDQNIQAILDNAVSGTVTGAIAGGAIGFPGGTKGTEGTQTEGGKATPPALSPEAVNAAKVETPATPAELPKLVESASPKFRKQVEGKSQGIKLDFEDANDKALYVATEARQGKRSKAAREHLETQGYDQDSIDNYGSELRARVEEAAGQHITGDTLRIAKLAETTGGVNSEATQPQAAQLVTKAVAPTSTEAPSEGSTVAPPRVRDTVAATADAAKLVPDFQASPPANKEQAKAADAFRKHGVELVFYSGKGKGVRLTQHDGVLFINKANVKSDLAEAVSHEFMHDVRVNKPELFKEFLSAMPADLVAKAKAEYADRFAKQHAGEAAPDLDTEAVTLTFGQLVRDNPDVWAKALGEKPGLVVKVRAAIRDFVHKLTGSSKSKMVAQALKTFEKNAAGTEAAPAVEPQPQAGRIAEAGAEYLPTANEEVRKQAEEYSRLAGIDYKPNTDYAVVNEARAKEIAKAYDVATHSPDDPAVKASYEAFKKETLAQYDYLKGKGVTFEPWTQTGQPYADSAAMLKDVRGNKHLWFFQGGDFPANHPMMEKAPGSDLNYNDIFRAVHDYFGHAKEGVGFGPRGEENAWRSHSQMYSELARGAMTSETRGQNSWVNFGPHGEANQANPKQTTYAEQKATLLPAEFTKLGGTGVEKLDQVISDLKGMVGEPSKTGVKGNLNDAIAMLEKEVNRPEYLPTNPKERDEALRAISSVPIRETPIGTTKNIFGQPEPVERRQLAEVARLLNDRTKELAGQAKFRESEKLERAIAAGIPEVQYQLRQPDSGKDWYTQDIAKMEATMKQLHPSLEDPAHMTIFKAMLAITSQGNNPNVNLKHAEPIYTHWDKTGEMQWHQPRRTEGGEWMNWPGNLGPSYELPFTRLKNLIDEHGIDGAAKWLLSKHPVKELRQIQPNIGGKATDQTYGMEIFGPKIGVFALNQHGINEKITKDMWFSRTWNRWMGTMMEGGEIVDAPRNAEERAVMDKAVGILADRLGMAASEVQAVLWYHEQQLFKAHGAKVESGSYSKAAEKLAAGDRYDSQRAEPVGAGGETQASRANAKLPGLSESNGGGRRTGRAGVEYLPAVKPFLDEDLRPAATAVGQAFSKAWTGVKSIVAPHVRSPEAGVAKGIFRERGAELAQRYDRVNEAFREAREFMDKVPQDQTREFIDRVEKGMKQADPALQPIADGIRAILDNRLKEVQSLGTGKLDHFIEDYFPHLWKDPVKAKSVFAEMAAKAPLQGRKGFLKKRSLPLFSDGIAKGLEPITENPVEAMMLRVREMDKYITTQKAFQEMDTKGMLLEKPARDPVPVGYAKINDSIANIYAKPSLRGAIQIKAEYVAPEPVANLINNYLSPGIRGHKHFGPLFRGYLGAGNVMNQVQLGMSFFHLLNTTIDSSTSRLALAIKQGTSGQFKEAAKSLASSATIFHAPFQNWKQGNLLLQEWNKPGSTTPEIAAIVDVMKAAGGRTKMDDFYQTGMTDKMMEAFRRGNVIGGALRAPFAGIEQAAKPVMEKVVPRMKMGVFMDMARYELQKLGPGASREQIREAAGKAWDSVDNRMGELVYDNLFWNKAFKDLAMASTRSVGWNLGTFRELGGGAIDLGKALGALAGGKKVDFTHRMAYTVAMPIMAGLIGGITHKLLTGSNPSEFKDWFFPKTGEKDKDGHDVRLALPSYMKDILAYSKNPGQTLSNKIHPMLNTIIEMLANRDYYGTEIRNADDPYVQQALDLAKHGAKAFTPFGIREMAQLAGEGQGSKSLLPLIGIVKARKDITNTPAEELASEIMQKNRPVGSRTKQEAEKTATVRDLAERIRAGDKTARSDLANGLKAGVFTESDLENLKGRIRFHGLERTVRGLDMDDAMKVWGEANADERQKIGPVMFAKLRASKALTREQRVKYMATLQQGWAELKGK